MKDEIIKAAVVGEGSVSLSNVVLLSRYNQASALDILIGRLDLLTEQSAPTSSICAAHVSG